MVDHPADLIFLALEGQVIATRSARTRAGMHTCRQSAGFYCFWCAADMHIISWDLAAHLLDQQFALAEPLLLQSAVTWAPPIDGQGPTDTDAKRAQDLCRPRAAEYGLIW